MTEATEAAAKAKEPRGGYDFTKGVPATIACTFTVPTLPGSPTFTHHLRRRASGIEMSEYIERLTADGVGVAPAEKESRRREAEAFVYGELMTELPVAEHQRACGVEGYGEQDSMTPEMCVRFFTSPPSHLDDDTIVELRNHVGYALSSWLRQKSAEGDFR